MNLLHRGRLPPEAKWPCSVRFAPGTVNVRMTHQFETYVEGIAP